MLAKGKHSSLFALKKKKKFYKVVVTFVSKTSRGKQKRVQIEHFQSFYRNKLERFYRRTAL